MDTQVRGLQQANRNAMDGISLIQTAEGALNEVHSMLQRIRELAVQVSNGTYDAQDRKAVQDEVFQMQNEIQRISDDIEFNEMKLLNGDIDRRAFSTDDTIANIVSMSDTVGAGNYNFTVTTAASKTVGESNTGVTLFDGSNKALIGGTININGEQIEIAVGDSNEKVYAKLRDLCSTVDISLQSMDVASPTGTALMPFVNTRFLQLTLNQFGNRDLTITGNVGLLGALGLSTPVVSQGNDVVIAAASIAGAFPTGTTYTATGQDIIFESNNNFELRLVGGDTAGAVTLNILKTGPLNLQIGANEGQFMEIRIQNLAPRSLGITEINLSTSEGAQEAITIVDDAIQTISSVRSKLGAYQNRLEHTIANLESASENMTASLSRILDADMAYEMSQFTQQNIIQQAGTSMLAQANQRPQSLLQLLQG
jgi:flagellin